MRRLKDRLWYLLFLPLLLVNLACLLLNIRDDLRAREMIVKAQGLSDRATAQIDEAEALTFRAAKLRQDAGEMADLAETTVRNLAVRCDKWKRGI